MTPRRWYAIATLLVLVAAPALSAAATNRVINGDFEIAGTDPTDVPGWMDDHCDQRSVDVATIPAPAPVNTTVRVRVPSTTCTVAADGIGVDQSRGALVKGPEVRRSANLFAVTAGETLDFSADIEILNGGVNCDTNAIGLLDCDNEEADHGGVGGASGVAALEFVNATGSSMLQVRLLAVSSLGPADGFVHYDNSTVVVPAGAVYARVLIGGSPAHDGIDPIFTGAGLDSPTSLVVFDNVFVGN